MGTIRNTLEDQITNFLKHEWPSSGYSAATFASLATCGNDKALPRFLNGGGLEVDTADRFRRFMRDYRENPELTIELARIALAEKRAAGKKKTDAKRRGASPRRARAAA